jgi:DNA helicase II / ATP-dependent DNA helicase PcrA
MSARAVARSTPAYRRAVEEIRENPGQWRAYNAERHCVVVAGPGSGKTKTLTVKIAKLLIETIREPRGLACITYNTECARELKTRLERLGIYETDNVFIGTVHSFCLKRVVIPYAALAGVDLPPDFQVASPREQERLFARAVTAEIGANERPESWRTRADEYRRTHLDRDSGSDWQEDEQLAGLIARYEALLRENGFIDFDDMVLIGLQLIESHRWIRKALRAKFPVIVVDEYQDLGVSLHRIIEQLCFRAGSRLFAVGDPDQSIYGFTGARPELLRQLAASDKVESVTLPFNYRSGPTIVRASEIALGEERGYQARGAGIGTVDFHERPAGLEDQAEYICGELIPDALARIDGLRLGDIAVLYLDKNDGDVIAEAAAANGYPTIRIDRGAPYPKTPLTRWLEACAAWCAGGWRTGKPRLSAILADWASISKIYRSSDPRMHPQKVGLLRFLLSHRNPDLLLAEWLTAFRIECLDAVLDADATLRDERDTLSKVIESSVADGPLADWTLMMFGGQGGSPDHLNLITLHSAKGLEFKVVVMMGMDQGRIPHWSAGEIGKREPRRLFYVGLTRAKAEVHMTYSGWTENRYGRRFDHGPSEFLAEVRDRLRQAGN